MSGRPSRRSRSNAMDGSLSLADLSPDVMENILKQLERDVNGENDCRSMREACDNMKQLARVYKVVVPCDDPSFWKARCTENGWLFGSEEYIPIDTKHGPDSLDRWKKQYHLFCKIANYENENVDGTIHLANLQALGSFHETTGEMKQIVEGAFKNCRHLRLTHLPDGIRRIEHRTFQGCRYLTLSNGLPESLTFIGGDSFYACMRLNFDHLPTDLEWIAPGAFNFCKSLVLAGPFPAKVPRIQDYTFQHCTRLALPALPPNLLSVGSMAFLFCESLRLATLPETIIFINRYSFAGCKNIALTKLPEDLVWIGRGAFEECKSLKFTKFPDKMNARSQNPIIQPYAFRLCNEPIRELANALYTHLGLFSTGGEDENHPSSSDKIQRWRNSLQNAAFLSESDAAIALTKTLEELEELEDSKKKFR